MNNIIKIFIQTVIIMAAGIGWSCDNIVIKFVLFLLACIGIDGYHEFLKKIEKE